MNRLHEEMENIQEACQQEAPLAPENPDPTVGDRRTGGMQRGMMEHSHPDKEI